MIRWALAAVAAAVTGSMGLLLGLYLSFPTAAARDRAVFAFDDWAGGEYALDMASLSPWRLTGVKVEDATLYTLKKGRRTKDNPKPGMERSPLLRAEELAVRVQLLPLVLGKRAFSFVGEIYGGTIDGSFSSSDAATDLVFSLAGVDLGQFPIEKESTLLNLLGKLNAEADLHFDTTDVKKSTGDLSFSFAGLTLAEGSKVSGFELPTVNFSKAEVAFDVKNGKMEVTKGEFDSDVVDATLSGDITLNKKLSRSRLRLEIAFSLPEELDQLARLSPDLKRARDDEGKYHYHINGTLLSPTFRAQKAGKLSNAGKGGPLTPGALGARTPGRLGVGGGTGVAEGADEDMTPEERRQLRLERLKQKREERLRAQGEGNAAGDPIDMPLQKVPYPENDLPPGLDEPPPGPPDDLPPGLEEPMDPQNEAP